MLSLCESQTEMSLCWACTEPLMLLKFFLHLRLYWAFTMPVQSFDVEAVLSLCESLTVLSQCEHVLNHRCCSSSEPTKTEYQGKTTWTSVSRTCLSHICKPSWTPTRSDEILTIKSPMLLTTRSLRPAYWDSQMLSTVCDSQRLRPAIKLQSGQ